MSLYEELRKDVRFRDGLTSCINCGICTAICPAAEFFDYDPRMIATEAQSKDEIKIEKLLKGDTIWYCGQCMSCKTRCPRGNCVGYVILALRKLSQEKGYFTESKRGRQQYALKKMLIPTILEKGYCIYPDRTNPKMFPEQGPVWEWIYNHKEETYNRMGANYKKEGAGALREIPDESLSELNSIFDVTGATKFLDKVTKDSEKQAEKMNLRDKDGNMDRYFDHVYTKG